MDGAPDRLLRAEARAEGAPPEHRYWTTKNRPFCLYHGTACLASRVERAPRDAD
jgi:hypothetical protein